VFHAGLTRDGPGLLLRDILRRDAAVLQAAATIRQATPDILLLLKFDHDHDLVALRAFAALLDQTALTHLHAPAPNAGRASGLDLDGNGRTGTPDDAWGYGRFWGAGGMALLSRLPLGESRDFSAFLWRDLPDALLPLRDDQPFPDAIHVQPLSSTGHWDVPVLLPQGHVLHLLAWHAGPPVFGGPYQRNLRRNHDETRFWGAYLDGLLPMPPPQDPIVVLGQSNLDPDRGDGMRDAMRDLLDHPRLQDPTPGAMTTRRVRDPQEQRVAYILPDRRLRVVGAGQIGPDGPGHALIWVDIALD
jgi:hypothetical protein